MCGNAGISSPLTSCFYRFPWEVFPSVFHRRLPKKSQKPTETPMGWTQDKSPKSRLKPEIPKPSTSLSPSSFEKRCFFPIFWGAKNMFVFAFPICVFPRIEVVAWLRWSVLPPCSSWATSSRWRGLGGNSPPVGAKLLGWIRRKIPGVAWLRLFCGVVGF